MKTISILSQKGGSGKTTLALHLAVAAQEAGHQTVIIDLDPQASATMWHEARGESLPYVQSAQAAVLTKVLKTAGEGGADLTIVDTAPQTDNPAVIAAQAADLVLVPCKPSVMDLRAIQNTIRLTQIAGVTPLVIFTQIEPFGTLYKEAGATVRDLGVEVCPYGLGRRVAYHHGLIDGRTALEFEPKGKAAEEVRLLFQHIRQLAGLPSSH